MLVGFAGLPMHSAAGSIMVSQFVTANVKASVRFAVSSPLPFFKRFSSLGLFASINCHKERWNL